MKISFIGYGNIAKALAENLSSNSAYQLQASAPSLPVGINAVGVVTNHNNLAVLEQADVVILAVKPAIMADVLAQIKHAIPANCVLVSLAAGLSLAWLEKHCRPEQAIVRAMPNVASAVGQGSTPLIANTAVTRQQQIVVTEFFQCSGIITWLTHEAQMDIFTALSGSGPAYVFLFLEAMADAAEQLGLSAESAKTFALQTVSGAASVACESGLEFKTLREKVTSPNGTTAAAIQVLQEQGFESLLFRAMEAAMKRAQQLGCEKY